MAAVRLLRRWSGGRRSRRRRLGVRARLPSRVIGVADRADHLVVGRDRLRAAIGEAGGEDLNPWTHRDSAMDGTIAGARLRALDWPIAAGLGRPGLHLHRARIGDVRKLAERLRPYVIAEARLLAALRAHVIDARPRACGAIDGDELAL